MGKQQNCGTTSAPQADYYANINPDLLTRIPLSARSVLEIGCGGGALGRAWLARNPQAFYAGIEMHAPAAQEAAKHLSLVVNGSVEDEACFNKLKEPLAKASPKNGKSGNGASKGGVARGASAQQKRGGSVLFDALVMGDVLEHLADPWKALARLTSHVREGGVLSMCVPNVSHWSIVADLLRGSWKYSDSGLLDRTHLRFFTMDSLVKTLRDTGWDAIEISPRVIDPQRANEATNAFAHFGKAIGIDPSLVRRNLMAYQWVIRAVKGGAARKPLHVEGTSLAPQGGVGLVRVRQPLEALRSEAGVNVLCHYADISPKPPVAAEHPILVNHRSFMVGNFKKYVEDKLNSGWIFVQDMDDDPHHWEYYRKTDLWDFRAAHAVTVSTPAMAQLMRKWNPNVFLMPNAVLQLPPASPSTPKNGEAMRVFFGAFNREDDWKPVMEAVLGVLGKSPVPVELTVVHDKAFYEALPDSLAKTFHPTLPYAQYMQVLAGCDIALLPLAPTDFNKRKSDIKLIECCAAGVVPICSPTVYADRPEHHEVARIVDGPEAWAAALAELLNNRNLVKQMRARGLAYVTEKRMEARRVTELLRWYESLRENYEELERQRRERMAAFLHSA